MSLGLCLEDQYKGALFFRPLQLFDYCKWGILGRNLVMYGHTQP